MMFFGIVVVLVKWFWEFGYFGSFLFVLILFCCGRIFDLRSVEILFKSGFYFC